MATQVNGTANDDVLDAGFGDQVVFAGGGKDTVVFTGSKSSYSYASSYASGVGATVSILDSRPGSPDGSDKLYNVEVLQFADGVIDFTNRPPSFLSFSASIVSESTAVGTVLGTLSAFDFDGDAINYVLTDNAGGSLRLDGTNVVLTKALDYEMSSLLSFSVKALDARGASSDKSFFVQVKNEPDTDVTPPPSVNQPPSFLSFSASSVSESTAVGTVLGTLSAFDFDGDAINYVLTDNAGGFLTLEGKNVVLTKALDYETSSLLSFSVKALDDRGASSDKIFVMQVQNEPDIIDPPFVNTPPTAIGLDAISVSETASVGIVIGRLSAVDAEGDAVTFELVDDAVGTLKIEQGNVLTVAKPLNFEAAQLLDFSVKVSDTHGASSIQRFVVSVTDVVETIRGTAKTDTVTGNIGDDRLFGFAGNDRLSGGMGKDLLNGGQGGDKLFGGAGADTFEFTSIKDSVGLGGSHDIVFDFSGQQGDRIDLSQIDASTKISGNQPFTYIGTAAFHGKAGEVRFEKQRSDTVVYADTNGDKKADFVIHFDDAIAMQKGFFVL